ncbi:MAG: phosphohydrolase [Parcubacteria group bacterium CG11_big_fil_rev_8_21_14_0_20_39_22]|nr:MAG: phosphohydrolase [Parcubacteria group bacterium CG11_big_fil_rev_8_21_14_0_20_39_22]
MKERKKVNKESYDDLSIANFLFEVGILSKTPRSGFHFLGTGNQSVAEHTSRVLYIGYTLASIQKDVDILKVLKMCLLHDLPETRISDLNYVHQKYVTREEEKVVEDLSKSLPFGKDIKETLSEYEMRESKESLIAKDADNLEWIISLKEQIDIGNERAKDWITPAGKRLNTEAAKVIFKQIMRTDSNDWWFGDKDDDWWVNRKQKKLWNK